MDEARAVLRRLARIEKLEREGAAPLLLLAEVRALLGEAEAWLAVEGGANEGAVSALDRCRRALAAEAEPAGAR